LHAEAKTEVRDLVLARKTSGFDFSFNSANAESAGDQEAGHIFQVAIDAMLQRFGVDKFEIDSAVLARRRVGE